GAGFVGATVAARLLADGRRVRILDNLSRHGSERNLRRLVADYGGRVEVEIGDLRDSVAVMRAVEKVDAVLHFGGQVSSRASVARPQFDFDVNLAGTVRLLEALRRLGEPPPLLFASTSKVYGALADLRLVRHDLRWEPVDPLIAATGISEESLLRPDTPYGCSRSAAEHYVLNYAQNYAFPAVVLRLGSVYGPGGGWVTDFLRAALAREPITIFGDGAQVRDILFADDLVAAVVATLERAHESAGTVFNVGGGADCAVSLLELIELIADVVGRDPDVDHAPTRAGDARYYVSDTIRFADATGWAPKTSPRAGLAELHDGETRATTGAHR
ncbi:MAG TPA: NAD-dependent epimerase/dehydratase family protein, partial [Gaiellaceae bacterium]|nr:NAD-dependent epimerase/dehydratase family protein [Gaiellaceae bacterium]